MKRRTQHSRNKQRKRSVEAQIEKLTSDQNRLNEEILKLEQRQQSVEHHLDTINNCIRRGINSRKRQEISISARRFIKHMASKERETTINDEIAKKQKLVKAVVDSTKETHQELATIDESEVPKLRQKNKAVVETTESSVLNSENEDDHQSNIELQLKDLIGKLPDGCLCEGTNAPD